MYRFLPSATAGAPGSVAPITSKSPPVTCARYHVDGMAALKCGSLANIGLPDAVIVPSTTQLFEPSPSVAAPARRKSATAGTPLESASVNAGSDGCSAVLSAPRSRG